MLIKEIKATGK